MRLTNIVRILCLFLIVLSVSCLGDRMVQASSDTIDPISQEDVTDSVAEYVDEDSVDYDGIQEVINHVMEGNETFDFETFVKNLLATGNVFSLKNIGSTLKNGIASEINSNLSSFAKIIAIAIVAAIFTNFATVFMDNQVAETGFYITYILLFCALVATFQTASTLAVGAVSDTLDFMKVLIPSYFMTVALASGTTSSILFYEFTLILITIVNMILLQFVIPATHIYLIIMLANNLSKEDKLSKFANTIATIIKWLLKTLIAFVIGFNAIQALVAPFADNFKRSILVKAGAALPGIGNLLSGVTETVLGAGILLKNSIGVAGVVVIILICAMPIIKLVIYYFIYKFGEAIVQPISDKRILNCIGACSEAISLLLQVVIVCAILFLITLTIVTAATSIGS